MLGLDIEEDPIYCRAYVIDCEVHLTVVQVSGSKHHVWDYYIVQANKMPKYSKQEAFNQLQTMANNNQLTTYIFSSGPLHISPIRTATGTPAALRAATRLSA